MSLKDDAPKLTNYLRKLFSNQNLRLDLHPKKDDMAEVMIGEDFVGPIYYEKEDGEVSYQFQIAILDIDLEED